MKALIRQVHPFLMGLLFLNLFTTTTMNAAPDSTNAPSKTESVVIGGGCFWCMEAVFQRVEGVTKVTSGFAGGQAVKPSYEEVCTGRTGHAEVIKIEYNPAHVTLEHLLDIFWAAHDPTTLNRQGADTGTQYRSIILYANEKQKAVAEKAKAAAAKEFSTPVVTEIVPLKEFYSAEEYHQNYYNDNKNQGYCQIVITPKLRKLINEKLIKE